MNLFTHIFAVEASHIDELGHVNNVIWVEWVQEISKMHWLERVPSYLRTKYQWVVLRHEIVYKAPAFEGDEIKGETRVMSLEGVRSVREVIFYKQDKMLLQAKSTWCFLDAKSFKPIKILEEIKILFD